MYYHKTKQLAEESGRHLEEHFTLKAELEPNNGWVCVLIPKTVDVFKYPLYPLLENFEIDLNMRLARRPIEHVKMPALEKEPKKRAAPPPPPPPPPGAPRPAAPVAPPKPVAPPPPPPPVRT